MTSARNSCLSIFVITLIIGITRPNYAYGSDSTLFLHPSVELFVPWCSRYDFDPSESSSTPKLVMIREEIFVPFAFDLGIGLQNDFGRSETCLCPEGPSEPWRCADSTTSESTSECHFVYEPGGFKVDIYLDVLYRHFNSKIVTTPRDDELAVADVVFNEGALKLGFNFRREDYDRIINGASFSFIFGKAFPGVSKNYNSYDISSFGRGFSFTVMLELLHDFADWLYVSIPISIGISGLDASAKIPSQPGTADDREKFGFSSACGTFSGIGLRVGSRIPAASW